MSVNKQASWIRSAVPSLALLLPSCGSASLVRPAASLPAPNASQPTANYVESPDALLLSVMQWEAPERSKLDSMLREPGQVAVVRYYQSGFLSFPDCLLHGSYNSQGLSPHSETQAYRGSDSAGGFGPGVQAGLGAASSTAFEFIIAGEWVSARMTAHRSELQGSGCVGATHFIRRALTGAFARRANSAGSVDGGASAGLVGFQANSASQEQLGSDGGNLAACGMFAPPATSPGCGAIVQIELVPIAPSIVATVELLAFRVNEQKPSGLSWDALGGAPDPVVQFEGLSQPVSTMTPKQQDQYTWQGGPFYIGKTEVTDGARVTVTATDMDVMESDPIGIATLERAELEAGGVVRKPLLLAGVPTGEITIRVTVSALQ